MANLPAVRAHIANLPELRAHMANLLELQPTWADAIFDAFFQPRKEHPTNHIHLTYSH